jgi:hypothetical protein
MGGSLLWAVQLTMLQACLHFSCVESSTPAACDLHGETVERTKLNAAASADRALGAKAPARRHEDARRLH